jgi:hypothetical protein
MMDAPIFAEETVFSEAVDSSTVICLRREMRITKKGNVVSGE